MFRNIRLACALIIAMLVPCWAGDTPGVTATEIKIGGIFPLSGPASSIGQIGHGVLAYVQSINDRGGINGRKINYVVLDDAYSPPKAFEHARRLVESDEVAFMFSQLGTAGNAAVAKYLAAKRVPTIAIVTGASKFTSVKDYPLTTTGLVSYDTEGKIYAKYLMRALPTAKYAILFQNDDLGRDYVNAFKAILGADFDKRVVTASYEVTEPTVDSQVVALKSSGAQALFIAGTPKFAAQASSIAGTLKPAGLENSVGVIVGTPNKDPNDQKWTDDEGIKAYRTFFDRYLAGSDITNTSYLTGYQQGLVLEQILRQCGDDLSRDNVIKQAKSLKNLVLPTALPGIRINTSESNNMIWTQLQLQRWTGTRWEQFGEILDASSE